MNKARLFLLCPECYLELEIKKHFTGKLYFLTALGSVFDVSDAGYRESIQNFINKKNINEIIIVNNSSCRLIQSVLNDPKTCKTYPEEILQILYLNCQIEFLTEKNMHERAFRLSKLNIELQAELLREIDFIGDKIEKNETKVRGMIYERERNHFSEVILQ